ncbi:hypothetical protein SMACR_06661 [Sordaria macrospora]|uniref:WGS project CABT00000000 data, contig 2.13 n=2 Tax=Sordaria macrospora TaxID=5147 RepID=F7VY92_SORMK|nr:uncharacterized protein SMAC_06661 [Sordaria macrospora k-hell]KAA8632580.1 hypothetical protein SMACR_06661 [Sordaria macrospora]WPJ62927.1 hypothetical protein SMAC4_06661 [Sordaria macrospora]CCC10486.1 unnamed protein product [Sordaria macrospora k-hell]
MDDCLNCPRYGRYKEFTASFSMLTPVQPRVQELARYHIQRQPILATITSKPIKISRQTTLLAQDIPGALPTDEEDMDKYWRQMDMNMETKTDKVPGPSGLIHQGQAADRRLWSDKMHLRIQELARIPKSKDATWSAAEELYVFATS